MVKIIVYIGFGIFFLYTIYCIIHFFLFKQKGTQTISDDLSLSFGLMALPLMIAWQSKSMRGFIFQSILFFCLAGSLISFRQALFRFRRELHHKRQKRKERDTQKRKDDKQKRYIATRARALHTRRTRKGGHHSSAQ